MGKQFVKHNDSSHWYQVDADGTVKSRYDATLREARKEYLFVSPTTIEKDIRANPTLARWIKNEVAKAFVANPRGPYETDENYATRCLNISDSIAKDAAAFGTALHDAIENYPARPSDPKIIPFYEAYLPWHEYNVAETVANEIMLADTDIGVAGRCDRIIMHKQHGLTIVDYKTQKVKDKPAFYSNFPRQLSFYAKAYQKKLMLPEPPRIMSAVLNSLAPSPVAEKLYSREEQDAAYSEFLAQVYLWCCEKKLWNGTKKNWKPVFFT